MKRAISLILGASLSVSIIAGCSAEKTSAFSQEAEAKFINSYVTLAQTKGGVQTLSQKLEQNASRLSKEGTSKAIDALLYTIYQQKDQMNKVAEGMQDLFIQYAEKNKLDLNNPKDVEKVDNAVLKAYLTDAHKQLMVVKKTNGKYEVSADFATILQKYGKDMPGDLKEMIQFSKEEVDVSYISNNNKDSNYEVAELNYEVVAKRIAEMEKMANTYPKSYYKEWMIQSKNFYYQYFFGMNGSTINDLDEKLLPAVDTSYQQAITKYKGTQFAKDIQSFYKEYQKNGSKVNANVYAFLVELTKKESQTISDQGTSPTQDLTPKAEATIQNNIKEAIKENK